MTRTKRRKKTETKTETPVALPLSSPSTAAQHASKTSGPAEDRGEQRRLQRRRVARVVVALLPDVDGNHCDPRVAPQVPLLEVRGRGCVRGQQDGDDAAGRRAATAASSCPAAAEVGVARGGSCSFRRCGGDPRSGVVSRSFGSAVSSRQPRRKRTPRRPRAPTRASPSGRRRRRRPGPRPAAAASPPRGPRRARPRAPGPRAGGGSRCGDVGAAAASRPPPLPLSRALALRE